MKKGDWSVQMIAVIVLVLVVLFVILWIFKDQVTKSLTGYTKVQKGIGEETEGKTCETILGGRKCMDTDKCEGTVVEGQWSDCQSPKEVCCG